MLRQAPYDKIGQQPTPKYTNADPLNGDQGSIPNAESFNQLQFEAENLVALGGLTADGTNLFQWTQAASRGGIWADQLGGTGDLAVATLPIPNNGAVLPALLKGMRIAAIATASNTVANPKLRVMNIGASAGLYVDLPIVKEGGLPLAAGDIKAGRRYRFEADGAGSVVITGGGIEISTLLPYTPAGAKYAKAFTPGFSPTNFPGGAADNFSGPFTGVLSKTVTGMSYMVITVSCGFRAFSGSGTDCRARVRYTVAGQSAVIPIEYQGCRPYSGSQIAVSVSVPVQNLDRTKAVVVELIVDRSENDAQCAVVDPRITIQHDGDA